MAVKITKEYTCDRCKGPMAHGGQDERGDNALITVNEEHWCREGGSSPTWRVELCDICLSSLRLWLVEVGDHGQS